MKKIILAMVIVAAAQNPVWAQNGPVTSRLQRVLVYFYNYAGSDHQNTPTYGAWLRTLGATHGFTADTTRSQSVFTAANLNNYQVIFLFSAYYFGINMTAAQRTAVQNWYGANNGIACFHQCVRNQWGGTYPNWYDSLMGTQYQTYAGFGTGPVYVNAAVASSAAHADLAMGINSGGQTTQYATDYTQSWDDEWYTYTANPQGLGGATRIVWTTRRSAHSFGAGFTVAGENQPMAWAREVKGGRFVLNSFFHRDSPRTSTNTALRQFIDGAWVGTLRYLAGYDGCTDPSFTGYNPKATHHVQSMCSTTKIMGAQISDGTRGLKIGDLKVTVTAQGKHFVGVYDSRGKAAAVHNGSGPRDYGFPEIRDPGIYFVKVTTPTGQAHKRLFLQ